jgi:hypothetical protein
MNEIKQKSWDDVTIAMWVELNNVDTESPITKEIEEVAILTDTDSSELRSIPMSEFRKIQESVKFKHTPPKAEVTLKFDIDGKRYGMIPQLDFISTGEWMDAETWKEDAINNIHLYAALLYRPITKEDGEVYEIEPHKSSGFIERANLFKDRLSITVIHGTVLFFSTIATEYIKILGDYLEALEIQSSMKMTQTQTVTKKQKHKPFKKTGGSTI